MFWAAVLSALEAGTWLGWFTAKFGTRDRVRESLINGTNSSRPFKLIDRQLERDTKSATKTQRKLAAGITRGIRFFAGTRACELTVLKAVQSKWPGAEQKVEVKLHL